jgi:hypothetical protein
VERLTNDHLEDEGVNIKGYQKEEVQEFHHDVKVVVKVHLSINLERSGW